MHHDAKLFLDLNNLKVLSALGRGAKGVVFLVQTDNEELFALKAILRSSTDQQENKITSSRHGDDECRGISFEEQVLSSFHHPLLPKLHGVLITDKIVGYAVDYCPGRHLHSLRKKQSDKMFSNDIIRFYAAELVLALEYLHGLGVVYRDLKPENVMIQRSGHLMLVDFDLSTKLAAKSPQSRSAAEPELKPKKKNFAFGFHRRDTEISPEDSVELGNDSVEKSNSFVGTEDYIAPEIILGDGHDFSVDFWALGVMLYEMLYGTTPFRGGNWKETFDRIINKEPNLTGESTPLRDLIGKLLEKDPTKRIRVEEIKGHAFFNAVDWEWLMEIPRPPFIPELTDVEDMNGNTDIDLEDFVQRVFNVGKENNEKLNN